MILAIPPPSKPPVRQASDSRLLLVLDLDETLVFASEKALMRDPDHHVFDYYLYLRPGVIGFLQHAARLFRLAVWTSSTADYAHAVCSHLFEDVASLEFIWARDKCTRKWDWETQDVTYAKHLSKLTKYGYDLTRVLIVDDSPEKHFRNYGNLITVSSFEGRSDDDELRWLARYLQDLSTTTNVRAVEKRGWRSRYDSRAADGDSEVDRDKERKIP